jgi:hypothetical protein
MFRKTKANTARTVKPARKPQGAHVSLWYKARESGHGIVAGNPRLCLYCRQPIGENDTWTTYRSPPDEQFGSYRIIVHDRCDRAKH